MSDKSFGDHTNRNIVKNPLLLTAVTGLSLEDLTHNAVLLPVAQSQELITRQDQPSGAQSIPLGNSEPIVGLSSGDRIFNITQSNPPPITPSVQDRQHNVESTASTSKASAKSEDDFDVDEYFARLQGTRYVSAPINSTLKEDPQATEENLEEINLNEPERSPVESQSITADIAQNFSQLPTVLPQVASAVFSSFSNILNYKSREQTPDERPVEKPVEKPEDVGVPLMGMDAPAVKEVAPPPREPPVGSGGTANFRITTKKKAYAQIPGLSSQAPGDNEMPGLNSGQMPIFDPAAGLPIAQGNPFAPQQVPTHPPTNPGLHGYQIPPSHASQPRSYLQKPGYYPGQTQIPFSHVPGTSPLNINYGSARMGYAEMPLDVPLNNLGCTTPTMFHQYVNDRMRGSVGNNAYLHEIQENRSAQPHASNHDQTPPHGQNVQNINQNHRQNDQVQLNNQIGSHTTLSPITSQGSANRLSRTDTQNNSNISNPATVELSTINPLQDNIASQPQIHHQDHNHETADSSQKNIKIFNPLDESHNDYLAQSTSHSSTNQALTENRINKREDNNTLNPLDPQAQANVQVAVNDSANNLFSTVEQKAQQLIPQAPGQEPLSVPSTAIIPPPPMFSNLPRNDNQPSVGKSVLPPSVARRIGANHPIIKPQTMQPAQIPTNNIFIPTPISDDITDRSSSASGAPKADTVQSTVSVPSAFVQFHASSPSVVDSKSGFRDGGITGLSIPYKQPPMRYANDLTHDYPPAWFPEPAQSNQPQAVYSPVTQASSFPPESFNLNPLESNRPPLPPRHSHLPKNITDQCFDQNTTPEAAKPVAEPPKVIGNQNFRMTKKRPQYYSGPIEGIGAISNNVKPIIPTEELNAFQGALFNPNQQQPVEQVPNVESAPFDISQPTNSTPHAQFDLAQSRTNVLPEYNTAFDLSRPTSESFEQQIEQPQESKGFGIIGSLKSKLSSLDINKIQNTVTTFFDPTYNEIKKEPTTNQVNANYDYNQSNTPSFGQQENSLEIFVPNNELSQTYTQGYNSQLNYPNYNYSQSNQYYQNQAYYTTQHAYYHGQGYASPIYGSYVPDSVAQNSPSYANVHGQVQDIQTNVIQSPLEHVSEGVTQQNFQPVIDNKTDKSTVGKPEISKEEIPKEEMPKDSGSAFADSTYDTYNLFLNNNEAISTPVSIFAQINVDINKNNKPKNTDAADLEPKASLNFFDNTQFHSPLEKSDEISNQLKQLQISHEKQGDKANTPSEVSSVFSNNNVQSEITSSINFFENITPVSEPNQVDSENNMGNNLLQIQNTQDTVPTINVSTVPLFDLSTILAEKAKEITDLADGVKNVASDDKAVDRNILDSSSSADFFENISTMPQPPTIEDNDRESELSIRETCREVSKPEDKDVDEVTKHLIENITSPIQLLNPVVASLTESNTPIDVPNDFDSQQCAEISHITEETIETIQVQSASELLDKGEAEANSDATNYGWTTENNTYIPPEVLLEHDYSFQMDPNTLGFYGSNAMFFENIPNNASDELKAEFKSSQEDMPVPLPLPVSVPSAPPAEDDDTKSDETGVIDVNSIEQDAKKDFPIYEEFVIEPSETDDDKIEYIERERNSDDPIPEMDSFTNRVEKFKKMEETTSDKTIELSQEQKNLLFDIASASQNIASPSIAIASYFDTGNFAVDSRYRNSLSSPSAMHFQMGSPEIPMRIPPGFENEFKRRLSGLIALDNTMHDSNFDLNKNIMHIPETSTQTRPVITTTYSTVSTTGPTLVTTTSKIQPEVVEDQPKPEKTEPPIFVSVFGRQDSGDAASSITTNVEDKKETTVVTSEVGETKEKVAITSKVEEKKEKAGTSAESEKVETHNLPDPISFFSTEQEPTSTDNNFNRLASYFATPAKTDPEKSFFELSQSQNHYRHSTSNTLANNNEIAQNVQLNNNLDSNNLQNIPANVFIANLNLMKDLTSTQNIVTSKDQIIKTVNYFTVEYDNDDMKTLKLGEVKKVDEHLAKANISYPADLEENDHLNDDKVSTVVSKCKYCCNIDSRLVVTLNKVELDNVEFKYRKVMETDGADSSKTNTNQMETRKGEKRREVTLTLDSPREESEGVAILTENRSNTEYTPVKHHWFYRVDVEGKSIWRGFSATDSRALEDAFHCPELNETTVVPTDGGRYDVNVMSRLRVAVYWPDKPTNVRRCSWFYKGATLYVPYTEPVAEKLEEEYRHGVTTGEWHRRLVLPNNESVVMHGPQVMVHFPQSASDTFGSAPLFAFGKRVFRNPPKIKVSREQPLKMDHLLLLVHGAGEYRSQKEKESTMRPRVVRRGCDETEIEDPEPSHIDHLLLLCHGVGSACDMRFRSVEEVVDDFRATSLQLVQSHYRNSYDKGVVNRVEVLPISWHSSLHSGATGVDRRLAAITLQSIPRLRSFTNDTVLDVLLYTSPVFCQTIIDTVCAELNRIYKLFKQRNPTFNGEVSLGGHSLGSVILYDLLCHQLGASQTPGCPTKSYLSGPAGTGQPSVIYPSLDFTPAALYAFGSPIAMFECIRGVKSLGTDFSLPTCKNVFNIFHPYDPIAYRIEPLINSQLGDVKPSLIPHHKGRKRMHLELKDTMARVGADLKQKLMESLKATWTSMWKTQPPPNDGQLEKVVEEEMEKEQLCDDMKEETAQNDEITATPEMLGHLNAGRRVDYVLQEAPFEMINEYLFAMSSHVCYWESEDTMLLILREVYDALGVRPDGCLPMHTMTVHRTRQDETVILGTPEHPSTSRGGT